MYTADARRWTEGAVAGGSGLYLPGLVQHRGTRQVAQSFGLPRGCHYGVDLQTVEVLPLGNLRVCALVRTLNTVVGMTHMDQHTFVLVPEQLPGGAGYLFCAAEEHCRRLSSTPMVRKPAPPTEAPPAETIAAARRPSRLAPRLPVPVPPAAVHLQRLVAHLC